MSVRTVINDWNTARAWLRHELTARDAAMSTDRWQLAVRVAQRLARRRCRRTRPSARQFVDDHPELAAQADALAASSGRCEGFLETPALVLAARDLAEDDPLLAPRHAGRTVSNRRACWRAAAWATSTARPTCACDGTSRSRLLAHAGADDTQRVERFLQEARVTASLDHPNIVKVFDVGVSMDRPYLVAELLDGETLARAARARAAGGGGGHADRRRRGRRPCGGACAPAWSTAT